ncbi:hypothetical protein [Paenibacillus sp. LjRoot153]
MLGLWRLAFHGHAIAKLPAYNFAANKSRALAKYRFMLIQPIRRNRVAMI